MNVLFIEDEEDLSASGVLQMETHNCKVTPAYDLAEARELLESEQLFQLVIADHRLPDGLGIQFVAEMKELYPKVQFVVVSGCLSDEDVVRLKELGIPSYRKPLLYSKIVDKLRRELAMRAPVNISAPEPAVEEPEPTAEVVQPEPEEAPAPKKKKFFGLF
ncbi:MAG: response regulator [Coraliomargarita sp.]